MHTDATENITPEEPLDVSRARREAAEQPNDDLIQVLKSYADKLAADQASRGDLKIVSRALRELRYAFKVFRQYRHRRKVTIFGSARTRPETPAYQQAVDLGCAMARQDWLVITGAAFGIMEAGHVGAGREHSMGLNVLLPFEKQANRVIAGDSKLVHMKYFFTRKLMFVKECDAVVCLPGGFGTLDEALEVLMLLQTGKRDLVPLVLLDEPGGNFWSTFQSFVQEQLLNRELISAQDLHLYRVTDDHRVAVAEIMDFFRVYHSMRYVKDQLVLRLTHPLAEPLLEQINAAFADILEEGSFRQSAALPDEYGDAELADLPRLVFTFNRRDHGRLRQLINCINQGQVR
jgi:uncharacterized protein (TIGR00730 family)